MESQKITYLLRYVPDQCKAQQICDKAILENVGILIMCNKPVNNYPHTIVPEWYRTQEKCDKAVDTCHPIEKMCSWMLYDLRNFL